jgi:hypothetical protein
MDRNIEQHQSFHTGMEAWSQYTSRCMKREGSQKFDTAQFKKLIDGFAPHLVKHLSEEISTLLEYDKYDIAAVKKTFQNWAKHIQAEADAVSNYSNICSSLSLTKGSGASIPYEWTTLIGLMREGSTFLNCRLSFLIWYTMCLAGNIVLLGGSIPIHCLQRKGHWYACQKSMCGSVARRILEFKRLIQWESTEICACISRELSQATNYICIFSRSLVFCLCFL